VDCHDPLLRGRSEEDKVTTVALFLKERHARGMRDKGAVAATAGIRSGFTRALMSSSFLDHPILRAARGACRSSVAELREKKDKGPSGSVKLPLCESLMVDRRDKLWTSREWTYPDIDQRAVYIATMWAYDMAARVSEYTAAEGSAEDHCVRAGDLLFDFTSFTARGGDEHFRRVREGIIESCTAIGCWVRPSTNKTGEAVATKLIGRRHAGESQHLDDLVEWVTRSQVKPEDELFSRYAIVRGRLSLKRMRPRAIRESVKAICVEAELDPRHFSSHSIRKAALSHMRALGVSLEDRQELWSWHGRGLERKPCGEL
jgi:hypothetical protein